MSTRHHTNRALLLKYLLCILGVLCVGGCKIFTQSGTVTTTIPAFVVTSTVNSSTIQGSVDPTELIAEYETALLIHEGLEMKLQEIDDWIAAKNFTDAQDAGLPHFSSSSGDYYVNEVPLFHDKDAAFAQSYPEVLAIRTTLTKSFELISSSAAYYADVINGAKKGRESITKQNVFKARGAKQKASLLRTQAEKQIESFKEKIN